MHARLITCEAAYPSSASKSAASCNLQGKLKESGDEVKALQLELSNVKTVLETARSKAAADSTVRQKEIEDAKAAQLADAKKMRELKEQHSKEAADLSDKVKCAQAACTKAEQGVKSMEQRLKEAHADREKLQEQLRDLETKLAVTARADQPPQNDAKKTSPQLSKPRQVEQVSQQSQDGHWERQEGGGRILVRSSGGKTRCVQLERQTQSQDSDNEAADEAALLENISRTAARSDGLGACMPPVPAPAAPPPTCKQMPGAFLKSGPYDSGSSNSREDASPPPVPSTATGGGNSESQQGALVLLKMCSSAEGQDPSEWEEDAAARSPILKSAGCGSVAVSACLSLSFFLSPFLSMCVRAPVHVFSVCKMLPTNKAPICMKFRCKALDFGNISAALPTYLCTYLCFGCPLSSISLFLPGCTCVGKRRHMRSEEMAPPQGLALGPQSSLLRPTGAKRSRIQTARCDGADNPSGAGAYALYKVAKATKASNAQDEEKDASRKEAGRRRKQVVTTFPGRSTGRKTTQKQAPKGKQEDEKKQQLKKEKGAKEEQKRLRAEESEKQKQLEEKEKQKRLQAKEDEKKQLEKKETKEAKEFEEEKRLQAEEIEKDKLEKEKEAKKEEKKRLKAKEDEMKKQRREEEKRLQEEKEAERKRAKQEQKEDCLRKKKEKEEKEKMDKAAELERRQQVGWRG